VEEFTVVAGGGQVTVRNQDGRYRPVATPQGFTDSAFRNAIAAFDSAYRLKGSLPDVDETYAFWPRIAKATYSKLFLTDEFKEALRYRGIEWDIDSGLSNEQAMALLKMTDWTDKRSTAAKLKELRIPFARWEAWLNQPLFKESYRQRMERNFAGAESIALQALIQGADSGKIDAATKLLEITGRWNPAMTQVEDARQVVQTLVESMIRHLKDHPDILHAIQTDVSLSAATLSAMRQKSLEA
jgi:hypothetical protein